MLTALRTVELPPNTQILVVDDGSEDQTAAAALREGAELLSLEGRGYGGALMAGFHAAAGNWLTFLDADGTYPAETTARLWDCRDTADMVMANRLTRDSWMPWIRKVGNRVFNTLAGWRAHQSVHDLCSGQRLFHRALLPYLQDLPSGLDFSPALTFAGAVAGRFGSLDRDGVRGARGASPSSPSASTDCDSCVWCWAHRARPRVPDPFPVLPVTRTARSA